MGSNSISQKISFGWEYKPRSSLCITCISSHRLKRSQRSCPRRVNAGNKNTPSTHHPRRRNVTTLMVGFKNSHICKNVTRKVVNPRDIAGECRRRRRRMVNPRDIAGECRRRRRRRMVNPRDIAGVCLLTGCLTSQQQASVSQGRICTDNFTCCHTEIEVADPTFYLTQSQYTDTGPTSPSADPITPGAWQGSHWSANF